MTTIRYLLMFILIGSLLAAGVPNKGYADDTVAPPPISAQTAALIDVQSGRILAEKDGDKRMRIASLTKIMTAIVAIEEGNINDIVTTPNHASGTEGSSIYLKRGEKMKLEDMLYGLMLRSGNDAAVAIAEHVGGSVEGFVRLMNEKAEYIGMQSTHFMNPHGLDHPDHYSTASDMARLTAYALRNPVFQKIVATKVKMIPWQGEEWDRKLLNKNKMLRLYEGADGVKTGYTKLARRCLSSSATRNGQQLAIVVLNAPSDWEDSMNWMDYGFAHYPRTELVRMNQRVAEEKTESGITAYYSLRPFFYPLTADEKGRVRTELVKQPSGPVLEVLIDSRIIGRVQVNVVRETMVQAVASRITDEWKSFWYVMLGGV
ncbi:D-alanyl-D-alanine carboxypeptidase family protein [Aneurinibacillus terranovensis]|uniref:D-alanyl-D-alanine carboxypeptidase family protein n=1 Tax=Aneurinibacillus terranovensis TaxID=278991 RepID=UPI000423D270|nr:D-alanyl-D-alanine carboxypeptidase family protein [Aneurinibacillus terranovensis]